MPAFKDLTGQVFSRLTILGRADNDKWGLTRWLCRCICGQTTKVRGADLASGHIQSSGCFARENLSVLRSSQLGKASLCYKHGHGAAKHISRTYSSWKSMIWRCTNPKGKDWPHYGGAIPPVRVCERWRDFENFLADMGERPAGTTLGRFGDVGNYEPGNCSWQTWKEQREEQKNKKQLQFLAAA